jgi:catechol 2,3-dioxygenase-like lactoylglutathione lyase family enzyme
MERAMERAQLLAVNPVLPSKDVLASIDFYVNRLGFSVLSKDAPDKPGYVGLGRDGVELHVQWHDPAEWEAVERPSLRFVVPRLEALFEEYRDKGVFHAATTLRETAWGTREFAFYDPHQNGLTFYRDLPKA